MNAPKRPTEPPPPSFPFPQFRAGQQEALEEARAAFAAGKRFVIVEAPTGSGKSAIGVTLAREASSAFVITNQKILQDQYVIDYPDLAVMKGRANYDCLVAPTHAAAAPCLVGRRYPECEACPYFTAKDVAMAANVTTLNYAYFLAELNYAGGFKGRDLLVLDEAHNAEGALMSFAQVNLSEAGLLRAGVEAHLPPNLGDELLFDYVEGLLPDLKRRSRDLEAELNTTREAGGDLQRLSSKQWLDSIITRLTLMLETYYGGDIDWVVLRYRTDAGQEVSFKPVGVAPLAEPYLLAHGERALLMSATILDEPTFLRSLGIDAEDAAFIRVPSTFPPENRPILMKPTAKLTRHHLTSELPKLVTGIAELAGRHEHEKGVIHTHSYRINRFVTENLPEDVSWRVITHASTDGRDAALAQHLSSPEPTILLSPSMTEGIDLADDLARWQVLCKVPYPNLGDKQVAARQERDPGWYDWRTTLAVVQAYGRSVRSEHDHAVTYLLDVDFPTFLRRQRKRLPDWFLEAVGEASPQWA